jgi:RNA polymerase sigma-70 factor (ECF subfamily)
MPNSKEEQELIKQITAAKKGDINAERIIYSRFYGYGMSICIRYANDYKEAEEILNDSFMKAFKRLETFSLNLSFKAWFRRILINTSIDYHRKYQKYHHTLGITHAQGVSTSSSDALSDLSVQEILKLVQGLAPSYRMVFNLYIIEGYKHREIGEKLGITEGTSRATLATARHKLQKAIISTQKYNRKANG